jgi:uncharacterized protein YyaL (SSP411 family)
MADHRHTNALVHETSPYLLQHAHNPVQWYPWSEEALRRAREEDKPILLSIGYSACHWCHVMEHESFEDEGIAAIMNRFFVNIKVDREERPDLDSIYMRAVQRMTGRGGWPMTVFLTPDRVPFYCGTYFPPEDRHGMPGFPRVLHSVGLAYQDRKESILRDAKAVLQTLQEEDRLPGANTRLSAEVLEQAESSLLADFDRRHGGFGAAPKFPPSMSLDFLMRRHASVGSAPALAAAELTLRKMAQGGMYDQLGGGFHRYSVDADWKVPHFEKMLYDNALLSRAYLNAWLLTRDPLYRQVAQGTIDYILREMTSRDGGFFSSQDADSEGEEGRYYTWESREVGHLLGPDAGMFCRYYGITAEGHLDGRSILHLHQTEAEAARATGVSREEWNARITRSRAILLAHRETRVRPGRDEKILTSWNGLMLKSLAEAGRGLEREEYCETAVKCAEFLLAAMNRAGHLAHSHKDGEARVDAFLDDYACLADGLISLYESTFESRWLREALRLAGEMTDRFLDPAGPGFFLAGPHEDLIQRPKELYDNATPSGNSVAAHVLLHLARLTGEDSLAQPARALLQTLAEPMAQYPAAFGNLLGALDYELSDGLEIVILGDPVEEEYRAMMREVSCRYLPNKVLAGGTDPDMILLRNRAKISGRPTAYVCRNHLCLEPVLSAADLAAQLAQKASPPANNGPMITRDPDI